MNPIAGVMLGLGTMLLALGVLLAAKRKPAAGIAISLLGVGMATVPFVATFVLFR